MERMGLEIEALVALDVLGSTCVRACERRSATLGLF